LTTQQQLQQPQGGSSDSDSGGCRDNGRSSSGVGRDTLRPAADATWRPEMNYCRFGSNSYA